MIKYDRFWVTMKERGITQYDLYEHYQITRLPVHFWTDSEKIKMLKFIP